MGARVSRWTAGLLVVLLWAASVTGASARPAGAGLAITAADASAHPEVSVTVTAPRDVLPPRVGPRTFRVSEGGRPVAGATVEPVATDLLDIVLLIDTSGSMADAMPAAVRAATGFLDALPRDVDVEVVSFGDAVRVVSPFGSDRAAAVTALRGLRPRGETALYDAAVAASRSFPQRRAEGTNRTLVVLSDGGDTVSTASLREAAGAVRRAGANVFAVELVSAESDRAALARLAGANGRVVPAADTAALERVYARLASQLTRQYRLTWTTAATGPTRVRVGVRGTQALAARTVRYPAATPVAPRSEDPGPAQASDAAPAESTATVASRLVSLDWWSSRWLLWSSLAAVAVALFLLVWIGVLPAAPRPVLRRGGRDAGSGSRAPRPHGGLLTAATERTTAATDRVLRRLGLLRRLDDALDTGGIELRASEFVVLTGSIAATAGSVGLVLGGALAAVVAALLTAAAGLAVPAVAASRRREAFAEQLADVLQMLGGSLRIGHGLLQAVDTVAQEAEAPARDEFQRVVLETRLGRDLGEALHAMARRMRNVDFSWVVQAIDINREVGGDLAEVLESVAETIRERQRLRRHVAALSAEGKLSAAVLLALPFVMATWLWIASREYVSLLLTEPMGRLMLIGAVCAMAAGTWWIRKVIRVEY